MGDPVAVLEQLARDAVRNAPCFPSHRSSSESKQLRARALRDWRKMLLHTTLSDLLRGFVDQRLRVPGLRVLGMVHLCPGLRPLTAVPQVAPKDVKQLRACIKCHLVKTVKQFEKFSPAVFQSSADPA
jgi:hypothetical protein